ncbi:MAG: hypothetical protein HN742_06285 [Lentisphaerae bacterium]|jgi:hypothetical protein|nr:hypothetical protein [Lentisphaerota bacterium]MBT4820184.1 hypothetical protein [Lentisphaerota bacterium]MBT5610014.1 hypothetical protein [Lentisphaerota bacterium]MBT7059137.1 hypothetical protein [Lentisphaerota bacterium]MBT7841459.1 hypothetical protein [Lentisphaerota bacterium]
MMERWPGMVMIGAAGRNVGKTEYACSLIRAVAPVQPVTGLKVTTVSERNGPCPRGGTGCGVCSSLDGDFCLTEERNTSSNKDTCRMLEAGARQVFWLRVLKDALATGAEALKAALPLDVPIVCESNSLRGVLEPDLFLIIRERGAAEAKQSAANVMAYADQVILFDKTGFDVPPAAVGWAKGVWRLSATPAPHGVNSEQP